MGQNLLAACDSLLQRPQNRANNFDEEAGMGVAYSMSLGKLTSGLFVIAVIIGMLAACVTSTPKDVPSVTLSIPIIFLDSSGKPIARKGSTVIVLGYIPGDLFGTYHSIAQDSVDSGSNLLLGIPTLESLMKPQSAALSAAARRSGFAIEPADTRIARVAVVTRGREDAAFVEGDSSDVLFAVYFDRPCRLTGHFLLHSARNETRSARVDVLITRAGISWLEYSPEEGGGVLISAREQMRHPLFVVGPSGNFTFGHLVAPGLASLEQ